jgi:hypothetical protein
MIERINAIYRKLDKLKEFAERDCGQETINAANLIDAICKKNNITDFTYNPHWKKVNESKHKDDRNTADFRNFTKEAKKETNKETKKAYDFAQDNDGTWHVISHTSTMRNILISFLTHSKKHYKIENGKVLVFVNSFEQVQIDAMIEEIKREWKKRLVELDSMMNTWVKTRYMM